MSGQFDFTSFPILETDRLLLRQFRLDDAEAMMRIFGDEEVLRFLTQPLMDSEEKAQRFINRLLRDYERREGIDWVITLKGVGEAIGMCGLYAWDRDSRCMDLGYHIRRSYWGRGFATEAARAVIGWGFTQLDLHRIQADCTEGHTASEQVMIKCGFTHEGTWRESCWEHGRFVNIRQYGLLRREFEATPQR